MAYFSSLSKQTQGVQFKALLQPLQECNYSANSIKMMTWGNINHVLALLPPQTLDPQVSTNLFSKICNMQYYKNSKIRTWLVIISYKIDLFSSDNNY